MAVSLRRGGRSPQEEPYRSGWLGGEAHVRRPDGLRRRWLSTSLALPLSLALAFTAGGLVAGSVMVLLYRTRWRNAS